MTVDEFDIQFDILYNNIASNSAPGLDAYEKSVFLSQAHRDIIIELYNGRSIPGISFESTEEARSYLKDYITETHYFPSNTQSKITTVDLSTNEDIFFIVKEVATIKENDVLIVPATQDEIINLLKNPFRGPSKNRVLRTDEGIGKIKLYSESGVIKYFITYISKPKPIILGGIDSSLYIDGVPCDTSSLGNAPEILHRPILERAVLLAKRAYGSNQ